MTQNFSELHNKCVVNTDVTKKLLFIYMYDKK